MSGDQPMRCPECGEDAVNQPPADLVPWDALGIAEAGLVAPRRKQPVPGHRPVRLPASAAAAPARRARVQVTRLEPPATLRPSMRTEVARQLAERTDPGHAAGTAGTIGRDYMTRVIARLGDLHRQAASTEPEPEAGA